MNDLRSRSYDVWIWYSNRMTSLQIEKFALPVLRFGIAALFLWFGLSQLTAPGEWVSWVPAWPTTLFGLGPTTVVLLNGTFETILGAALAAGFFVRWVALLLSLHLFFLAYEIGYNDIGVRDFALAVSTLALSMFDADEYTLDKRMNRG